MRDQTPGMACQVEELPASWTIPVEGRPAPEETVPDKDMEDSACMCCFDGLSYEGNTILFCDGCNASVHQACYGISEIPEGDFYCDRCQAVRWFSTECDEWSEGFAKDAVKCTLCTVHHGGLKPTTDGQWVHMCCAIWSDCCVIKSLDEMYV